MGSQWGLRLGQRWLAGTSLAPNLALDLAAELARLLRVGAGSLCSFLNVFAYDKAVICSFRVRTTVSMAEMAGVSVRLACSLRPCVPAHPTQPPHHTPICPRLREDRQLGE